MNKEEKLESNPYIAKIDKRLPQCGIFFYYPLAINKEYRNLFWDGHGFVYNGGAPNYNGIKVFSDERYAQSEIHLAIDCLNSYDQHSQHRKFIFDNTKGNFEGLCEPKAPLYVVVSHFNEPAIMMHIEGREEQKIKTGWYYLSHFGALEYSANPPKEILIEFSGMFKNSKSIEEEKR